MLKPFIDNIITYSKLAYSRGLVGAAGGNISMRCDKGFLITASGISLRDIDEDAIILVDSLGNVLDSKNVLKPSKETVLHLKIYNNRPEVDSVIHVHPPYATGYSVAGKTVPTITASAINKLIEVPMVCYADPGTKELADSIEQCVTTAPNHVKVIIMQSHGIIAFDKGMTNCFDVAELVEDTAKIAFISDTLSRR